MTGNPAELEQTLAAQISAAQEDDPLAPIAVLIGGTLQRPYLQRRLATLNDGIINVHFLTVAGLALALGERRQTAAGRLPLPPLADRVLLRQIAAESDGYFSPVREMPGFGDALFSLVRDLRGAGFDQLDLPQAIKGACEVPEKEAALTELFCEFLHRRRDFYGADDCLIEADTSEPPWKALVVHGVWDASDSLRSVLRSLAEQIPVTVLLPHTDTHADEATDELRHWLGEYGAKPQLVEPADPPSTVLSQVQRRIFLPPDQLAGALEPDPSLTLLSTPDPSREVREVVRMIFTWAGEGISYHEVAVAYRQPTPYRPLLEATLREAGIPMYLHEGTPLAERPIGRQALALLDLIDSGLGRRQVMDFLTDSRLPKETRERYDGAPAARWDRISRDAGVVEGRDQWQARLAAYRDECLDSDRKWVRENATRADALLSFIGDLARDLADHPGESSWGEHLAALRRLLSRYIADHEKLIDPLEGLARFDALGERVGFARFRQVVRGAIETMRSEEVLGARPGAFGRRGVNIVDVNSLRHLRFRAVAIVGLAERSFPPPPRQDPLLLDEERARLSERSGRHVPLRVAGPDPEPLQFATAVAAAEDRLSASYPRKGEDARPQLPSSFFRALVEAVTARRIPAEEIDRLDQRLVRRVPGNRIGAGELARAISQSERDRTAIEGDPALGRELLRAVEPRMNWGLEALAARFERRLTHFDGVLSGQAVKLLTELVGGGRSPSSLEAYATCPHRFFLGDVLHLRALEEPETIVQITPRDRGTLIHHILERFLGGPPAAGEELLFGPGEEQRLLEIAEEEFTACEQRGETGSPLIWSNDCAELREDLRSWLTTERQDPRFCELPNGAYEVRFGYTGNGGESDAGLSTDEPITVGAGDAEIEVSGRIDRLHWDEDRQRFRVVDYKTGKANTDLKDGGRLLGGRAVQLPLYLMAAGKMLGIEPAAGSAEYDYPTRRGGFKRQTFSGEDLRARDADLTRLLGEIASAIATGAFQMSPEEEWTCRWCAFDSLCPTARWRQIEDKSGDPVARRFADLREIE